MRDRSVGFLCLILIFANDPFVVAQDETLISSFGTAIIDGTFSPGEWETALRIPVFGESIPGSAALIMNDTQNLYFAFQAADDTFSSNDTFAIRFDNANNGTIDDGDDEILLSPNNYRDAHFRMGEGYGTLDELQSGAGVASQGNAANFFEVSHPLNGGDANDIAIMAGDSVGLAFRYSLDGSASADLTTFPPRSFSLGNRQLLYAELATATEPDTSFTIVNAFPGAERFQFDIDGAIGTDHYAEFSNLRFTAYDKSGNVAFDIDDDDFWSNALGRETTGFDPRLQFDHDTGRWFAVGASGQRSPNSAILVGVSATSDPTGDWTAFRVDIDPTDTYWADFPILGLDGNAVFVSTKLEGIETGLLDQSTLHVFPKGDLVSRMPNVDNHSVLQTPSQRDVQINVGGDTRDAYLETRSLPEFSPDDCRLNARHDFERVQNASTPSPLISESQILLFSEQTGLRNCIAPELAKGGRQPGTNQVLGQLEGDTFYLAGNFLYSATTMLFRGARAIQWSKIDVSTNEIVDIGFIGNEKHDYLVPAIAANEEGTVVMSYSRSGPSEFASAYASIGRLNDEGELDFSDPILLKAGSDVYDENGTEFSAGLARWSDYSTTVTVSPDNANEFWLTTGYVSDRNNASSWITQLRIPPTNPLACDFDLDGVCNVDDIDAVFTGIKSGNLSFDIDNNGVVDETDVSQWLEIAGNENAGQPYLVGDANLDGIVNAEDLNALGNSWQESVTSWAAGDFNGDGLADSADLNSIGQNWQRSTAAPVPEPSALWMPIWVGMLCRCRRRGEE